MNAALPCRARRRYMLWFQFKPAAEEALSANDYAMLNVFGEPPEVTAMWKADLSCPGEHGLLKVSARVPGLSWCSRLGSLVLPSADVQGQCVVHNWQQVLTMVAIAACQRQLCCCS